MLARLWRSPPLRVSLVASLVAAWNGPSSSSPLAPFSVSSSSPLSSVSSNNNNDTTIPMNDNNNNNNMTLLQNRVHALQDIIGADAGGRGMKHLVVPGDLYHASSLLARLPVPSTVIVLSGFPCCVQHVPPTETDGPPGTLAIARAAAALGHQAIVVVDDCNAAVFQASLDNLAPTSASNKNIELQSFPSTLNEQDEKRFQDLQKRCDLWIACERAGPAADGICYTMRGIDMNAAGLIAPLHRFVVASERKETPFIAIGDGGNELGMGKVLDKILQHIANADKIASVIPADHLIAASVSNWGGYALAAGAALCKVEHILQQEQEEQSSSSSSNDKKTSNADDLVAQWLAKCLPTAQEETELLQRAVAAGCRDGVSGQMEATVDGMPLETSLQCLADIRAAALGQSSSSSSPN